jgi:hypothetical protein
MVARVDAQEVLDAHDAAHRLGDLDRGPALMVTADGAAQGHAPEPLGDRDLGRVVDPRVAAQVGPNLVDDGHGWRSLFAKGGRSAEHARARRELSSHELRDRRDRITQSG